MTSARQIAANQSNAQHSTGPRTTAGKNISRLNAVKHALTGQLTIVVAEQHEAFLDVSQRLTASLNPAGEQEVQVAARIVRDTWRLSRAAANEDNVYALDLENALAQDSSDTAAAESSYDTTPLSGDGIDSAVVAVTQAVTYFDRIRDFDRAGLYEQRLKRGLHKDYALFRQLQIDRRREETNQVTGSRPSAGTSAAASNGSVFSTPPSVLNNCPDDGKLAPQIVHSTDPYVLVRSQKTAPPPPDTPIDPFWAC